MPTPDSERVLLIPDLFAVLPFEGTRNAHYDQAAKASSSWLNSHGVVPEHKRAFFAQHGAELLCARAYPYAGCEALRTMMDFVNFTFAVDDTSDDQSGTDAGATGRILLDAFRDPACRDGPKFAQMVREINARLLRADVPACYRRLYKLCEDWVDAFVVEAELRERGEVPGLEAYIPLRRANSGTPLCLGLIGFAVGRDLPDEIIDHPVVTRLHVAAADMVSWANDIYSYNREQSLGLSGNNLLTVLMHAEGCGLQTAADRAGARFGQLMARFQADKARLPSWGAEMDAVVAMYVHGMETWVVGSCEWSFETRRYFGAQLEEVRRTRVVKLYPKLEE